MEMFDGTQTAIILAIIFMPMLWITENAANRYRSERDRYICALCQISRMEESEAQKFAKKTLDKK